MSGPGTHHDPPVVLFDLDTDDPEVWRGYLSRLRRGLLPKEQVSPIYLSEIRVGGAQNSGVLDSLLGDPRAAFLEEWDHKVHHRRLWDYFGCDPAYDVKSASDLRAFEQRTGVLIPASLADFVLREHAETLLLHWNPRNNILLPPTHWRLQRAPRGYWVLRVIEMSQHPCSWYVVWKDDEATLDPAVFVVDAFNTERDSIEEFFAQAQCTANHWSEFLFDYAMEGDRWYEKHPEYRPDYLQFDRNAPAPTPNPR
jgi:hypothetical protein